MLFFWDLDKFKGSWDVVNFLLFCFLEEDLVVCLIEILFFVRSFEDV